jgi:hypothetical protein
LELINVYTEGPEKKSEEMLPCILEFFAKVLLIAFIFALIDKVIFNSPRQTEDFQGEVVWALREISPFELSMAFLYSISGPEKNDFEKQFLEQETERARQSVEYKNCIAKENTQPDTLPSFGGLMQEMRDENKCLEKASTLTDLLIPTGSKRSFFTTPVDAAWRVLCFELGHDRSPAHRLTILCQVMLGMYLAFICMRAYGWPPFYLVPPIFVIVSVIAATAIAIPLKYVAIKTLQLLSGVYITTGLQIVDKITETIVHSAVHGAVASGFKK